MPSPLVRTKLHLPRVRRGLVSRPRLVDGPARTSAPRLTLVSAPPGFGKTTLLTEWADAALAVGRAVAWVSLEETEQQPESFWRYVVTALDGAAPGVFVPLGGAPPRRTPPRRRGRRAPPARAPHPADRGGSHLGAQRDQCPA